jgi:hypothetical protein
MIIPIIIPIIVVLLAAIVYAVTAGFQVYHVYEFGVWDKTSIGVAAGFLIVALVLFGLMATVIATTDWSVQLFEIKIPSIPIPNAP